MAPFLKVRSLAWALFAVAVLVLVPCWATSAPQAEDYPHLLLGNPSDAKSDPADKDNFLMKKKFYALSYNNAKGTPNWVSWQLTEDDIGEAPRKPTFDPDSELPKGFHRVTHKDYTGSGFDRGHLCPHSDRSKDREMSFATFVMTNIIPQAPNVNQKAWNQLEIYCRTLVQKKDRRLYIIAGPDGEGGQGSKGDESTTIAEGKVTVPSHCWKVVVALPEKGEGDDLARITRATRVIAVRMPNSNRVGLEWAKYRTSVKEIEKETGLKFFTALPAELAQALKEKVDEDKIGPPVTTPRD